LIIMSGVEVQSISFLVGLKRVVCPN